MPTGSDGLDTSWTLVHRAAAGDSEARARFCAAYQPFLRAYLIERWRGSPLLAEVEDTTQDVFVECFKETSPLARAQASAQSGFRAFLVGIARHVAQRVERGVSNRPGFEGVDDRGHELADRATRLSRVLDREWARVLVHEARALMEQRAHGRGPGPARLVELLALRFGEGLPIRAIAARWGEDPARLHHDYARAREEFAECLRRVVARQAVRSEADLDAECARVLAALQ